MAFVLILMIITMAISLVFGFIYLSYYSKKIVRTATTIWRIWLANFIVFLGIMCYFVVSLFAFNGEPGEEVGALVLLLVFGLIGLFPLIMAIILIVIRPSKIKIAEQNTSPILKN